MSKYKSICGAINLLESVKRFMVNGHGHYSEIDSAIQDLMRIAKDVRYGGEWTGDNDSIADSLEHCNKNNCALCKYKYQKVSGCRSALKADAAFAIRALEKQNKVLRDELDMIRKKQQEREPAAWQREIMEEDDKRTTMAEIESEVNSLK